MKKENLNKKELPVKIYKHISKSKKENFETDLLAKFRVFLDDRPGSLAVFSSLISACNANISFFHYDRSMDSTKVVVEVQMQKQKDLNELLRMLKDKQYSFEKSAVGKDDVQITALENILEIKARLLNKPGTLAEFAQLFKRHNANVIYMFYNEDMDPEAANIALATKDTKEIDMLLDVINANGYQYRVLYRGSDNEKVEYIIGLKHVEKFFLRLKKLLSDSDVHEIKELVDSSQELSADLVRFYSEAGNNLEAIDIFEKVLTLASASRSRTGSRFSMKEMPALKIGDVEIYGFKMPTSENIYLFKHADELTMIDSGYGIYYEDFKSALRKKSLDPEKIKRIYLTHADADHAGMSGYFSVEFGTEVFLHPESKYVIENGNRASGTAGKLLDLNKYYTRLVNKFSECRFPDKIKYFSSSSTDKAGVFNVTDTFSIGSLEFMVLESLGGHILGNVFFFNKKYGLIFTADYLLNVRSLTEEDKKTLNVYKYLLISPNSNSNVFKDEMEDLKSLIKHSGSSKNNAGFIFPGHGDYYSLSEK
ncbi:MAG: MBL fold metallo-hydrolase [Nitrospiraceae bacterium]|nr:MBL fold metallo-hydrolase [Nitrospiraceae bacterium]